MHEREVVLPSVGIQYIDANRVVHHLVKARRENAHEVLASLGCFPKHSPQLGKEIGTNFTDVFGLRHAKVVDYIQHPSELAVPGGKVLGRCSTVPKVHHTLPTHVVVVELDVSSTDHVSVVLSTPIFAIVVPADLLLGVVRRLAGGIALPFCHLCLGLLMLVALWGIVFGHLVADGDPSTDRWNDILRVELVNEIGQNTVTEYHPGKATRHHRHNQPREDEEGCNNPLIISKPAVNLPNVRNRKTMEAFKTLRVLATIDSQVHLRKLAWIVLLFGRHLLGFGGLARGTFSLLDNKTLQVVEVAVRQTFQGL